MTSTSSGQTEIDLTWDYNYIDWDSWGEKLRLWINSGDLPDVAVWNYVHGDAINSIEQGLFYKFPDDWKERWPNITAAYNLTGLGDKLEELTGGTYVLPRPIYFENKPATHSRTKLVSLRFVKTGLKRFHLN